MPFANINNSKQYSIWVSKYRYLILFFCELCDLSLVDPLKYFWYVATFAQTFRSRCQQKPGIGQSFVTCEIWQIFKRWKSFLLKSSQGAILTQMLEYFGSTFFYLNVVCMWIIFNMLVHFEPGFKAVFFLESHLWLLYYWNLFSSAGAPVVVRVYTPLHTHQHFTQQPISPFTYI